MDWTIAAIALATISAGASLVLIVLVSYRVHRVEWEIEQLRQELGHQLTPFPLTREDEDEELPAFLKPQAD